MGKFGRRHLMIFLFLFFFPENRIWYFMQVVSLGNNLHEIPNPAFWENQENNFKVSSADFFYSACYALSKLKAGNLAGI